jgi:hypothetical protein
MEVMNGTFDPEYGVSHGARAMAMRHSGTSKARDI